MKPTSVIFIILSVILICTGVMICMSADNMANQQGVALFNKTGDSENNYSEKFEFDSSALKKIEITLDDVDINVYGNSENEYIELVNFTENGYDITFGKSSIKLSDISGISGIINLDTFKVNFDGFRNYLNYWKYKEKQRSVNIYIKESSDISSFVLKIEQGDISLENLSVDCDYSLSAGKGNVTITALSTGSSIFIESDESADVLLDRVVARDLSFTATSEGSINIQNSTFSHILDVSIKTGDFTYSRIEGDFADINVSLNCPSGTIEVFGKKYTGSYTENNAEGALKPTEQPPEETLPSGEETTQPSEEQPKPEDANGISVTVKNGSITITRPKQ